MKNGNPRRAWTSDLSVQCNDIYIIQHRKQCFSILAVKEYFRLVSDPYQNHF